MPVKRKVCTSHIISFLQLDEDIFYLLPFNSDVKYTARLMRKVGTGVQVGEAVR